MAKDKLRMSNKRFIAILVPIMVLLVALAIVLTCVANYWSVVLDVYLGRGERHTVNTIDTTNLDLDYYDVKYENDTGSLADAIKVAENVADEGIVLMKNNGVLPLAKTNKITPFGYRYVEPIYGGTGSGNVDTSKDYVYTPEKALKEVFGSDAINGTVENLLKSSQAYKITSDGIDAAGGSGGGWGADHTITEFDPAIYDGDGIGASCDGTTGVVFIGRFGGESWDLQRTGFYDGTPHQLALSTYEKEMLDFAKANCANVVVVINSSNQMELGSIEADEDIDAVLMIGGPGGLGFKSMAKILAGDVNPSGRTVDTYYANFSVDPVAQNFGEYQYANSSEIVMTGQRGANEFNPEYLEYEEGIYMGYRFYETAWYEKEQASEGSGDAWYSAWRTASDNRGTGVVYPFGHGLSYSTFTQKITDVSESDGEITVTVEVKNTSSVPGKDVVQIYYTAPYTEFDKSMSIEKSYVNLVGFGKTKELGQNDSDIVKITFSEEDMASYSYKYENEDGTKGSYILEAGDYTISCRKNAHELYGTSADCERTYNVAERVVYSGENMRASDKDAQSILNADGTITEVPARSQSDPDLGYTYVSNKFEDLNAYMSESAVTNLSRSNWGSEAGEGTFPTAPKETGSVTITEGASGTVAIAVTDRVMSKDVIAAGKVSTGGNNYDYENDPELGNKEGSKVYAAEAPTEGADNDLVAADLRGLDYYDETWGLLLDQLDFEKDYDQIKSMLFNHNYNTAAIESIGFDEAKNFDGPVGLTMTFGAGIDATGAGACAYPSEVVVASTYNTALVKELGEMIGQEAFQFQTGEGVYTNGWYAPGLNTHRSPFNGRNFEYYSEDGLLAGKMGAAIITGASSQGLVCYMKHFVLNDKELTQKLIYTWCTEQTFREIYLRPWEIAIKEATMTLKYIDQGENATRVMRASTGIMTSHNHVGATWAGSHYNLLTELVRGEWGYQGCIVTDNATGYGTSFDRMVRAGNDMWMGANMGNACAYDMTSNTAKSVMRNAIHNIVYSYVNSNMMNGLAPGGYAYYDMSPWAIGFMIGDIVVGLLVIGGIVWIVLRLLDEKKHPEKYKHKGTV